MKKRYLLLLSIFLFNIFYVLAQNGEGNRDRSNQVIGGELDSHGCLIGAGYSWNSSEDECVREWEHGNGRYQVNKTRNESEPDNKTNQGIGQELNQMIKDRKVELKNGNYTGPQGQLLMVKEMSQDLRELRVNNIGVNTKLNITLELDENNKTVLKTKLKNGEEIEIKMMPDTASEQALEKLKLKVCSTENNCTIQLKDVGNGNNEKIQYEVQIERHSRILGIFSKKMQVNAEVDADTGETVVHKPWWAFLAAEPKE